ncbi:type VII secretion protein EccB, partial [Streptomyces sp. SID625]|nr:type VII secretion protein EccB [Streptomyces sp. SID625]
TGPAGALPGTDGAARSPVTAPGASTVVAGAPVRTDAVSGDRGLLVRGPDGREYVVWRGSRLPLDAPSDARDALGYGS